MNINSGLFKALTIKTAATILFVVASVSLFAQIADPGVIVTEVTEELSWDLTPIQTTTFANGDNLNVAEEDWQWINYCSKRKPTVWIKYEDGKTAFYYNYYAITDPRGLVSDKSFLPTVDLIRKNEIPGFPENTFTKGYLEQDSENETVPTVPTPGDQYYWTTSKHESAAQGEEVAYIFKYNGKGGALSASTGQFCDGYAAIAYSKRQGKNYSYSDLLPSEYKSLNQEFVDYLLIEPGFYDNVKYEFNAALTFDSQGLNKSDKFSLKVLNDPSNKKDRISSLYSLDETLMNFSKYPKYKNLPLECRDSIHILVHTVWTGLESSLKKDTLPAEMLPENFRSNFLKAAQVGKTRQVERAFIIDANGELGAYKQKILKGYSMRGPMTVLLSPLGLGLKTVTKTYSPGYKSGARKLGVFLAVITPFAAVATIKGISNKRAYENNRLTPENQARYEAASKLATVGVFTYGFSLSANIVGTLTLGSKNRKLQKRIDSYMEEQYPYGIVIDYDRK
jgi:hypothetical protein